MAILQSNGILIVDAIPTHTPSGNEARIAQLINTSTRWYYDGSAWTLETGGGGQPFYYEVTKAQVDALISTDGLEPGATYKITDRGDRGIILKAVSDNQLSKEGQRIMLVPNTYENGAVIATRTWHSIWRTTITPSIGDKVIWNAHVWTNLTGAVGTAPDGDAVNWVLVPKTSFTEQEYVEKVFDITYDYENDWISQQRDEYGNAIGNDIRFNNAWSYAYADNEFIDNTDWNYVNHLDPSMGVALFSKNNVCGPITNNIKSDGSLLYITTNTMINYGIENNSCSGIFNNTGYSINNNSVEFQIGNNNVLHILGNSGSGQIHHNKGLASIQNNVLSGDLSFNLGLNYGANITNNSVGFIMNNIITGYISGNTSNITSITHNRVNTIHDNSNVGDIIYNMIPGSIYNNSNGGDISYNRNNGNIQDNQNTGYISYNINNGNISFYTNATVNVEDTTVNKP